MGYPFCLVFIVLLLPVLCYSHDSFVTSRATYYGSPDGLGTPTGACGYGEYGRTVYGGRVAGVSRLWRNGTGCGACYQVRCKNNDLCSDEGAYVVVTDYGEGDRTDFILSPHAYAGMATGDAAAKELYSRGVVEVEYRRVSCRYPGHPWVLKVHENSHFPGYLAIVILYQSGKNDVLKAEVWQADWKQWRPMRRAYGAVFDLENPPAASITLRFYVRGSAGYKWVVATNVIPAGWKAGVAYESQIVLN